MEMEKVKNLLEQNHWIIWIVPALALVLVFTIFIAPRLWPRPSTGLKSKINEQESENDHFVLIITVSGLVAIILLFSPILNHLFFNLSEENWPKPFYFINEGLPKFGEALLIAVFLAVTVDVYVKTRLTQEVAENVAKYMPGHNLPPEIREELYHIYKLDQYRKVKMEVTLEKVEGNPDLVFAIMEIRYTQINLTGDFIEHIHKVAVEPSHKQKDDHIHNVIQRMSGKNVFSSEKNPQIADYDEQASHSKSLGETDKNNFSSWKRVIRIPPHGESTFFTKVYYTLPIDHEEPIILYYAIIGVEIIVTYQRDIDADVTIGHRLAESKPIDVDNGGTLPNPTITKTWKFEGALLPYQPIIIKWKKGLVTDGKNKV